MQRRLYFRRQAPGAQGAAAEFGGSGWECLRAYGSEHRFGDSIHRLAMIVGFEEMTIAVHRHLQRAVAGECLNCLGLQSRVDPAGNGKMAKCMPVEAWR